MAITVTATEDMVSEEVILLEVGSYSFYEEEVDSEEGAAKLAATVAAAGVALYLI